MKITHIEFTKTFPVGVTWEKTMMAADIDDTEDPIECRNKLKAIVEECHLYKNVEEHIPVGDGGYTFASWKDASVPQAINDDDKFKTVDGLRIPQAYAKEKVINLQDEREYIKVEKEIASVTSLEELSKYKEYCGKNPDLMSAYMTKLKQLQ